MSTDTDRVIDAKVEQFFEDLEECPKCHHKSLFTREFFPATRIDPACSAGSCLCHQDSVACGCTYEWG